MKKLFAAVVILMTLPTEADADVIKPNDVRATSQFGLGLNVENLVNGDQGAAIGLSNYGLEPAGGAGVLDDGHQPNLSGQPGLGWISGCMDAGIEGGDPGVDCSSNIFAVEPEEAQIVEFEFDGAYDLTAMHVWNENDESFALDRGVDEFELQVNTQRTGGTFTSLGTFNLTADDGFANNFAQELPFTASGIRRVRFLINSRHGGEQEDYVGLAEVRFEGTLVTQDLAADGDKDGDVDGNDLLVMMRGMTFGELDTFLNSTLTATQSEGDYDNNNVVNGDDVTAWAGEFGQSAALSASIQGVPEPSTLLLGLLSAIGILLGRRPALAWVKTRH